MIVFHKLSEINSRTRSAVAIGNFDGCHLGHVALIKQLREKARRFGYPLTVFTFYPHPVEVLNPSKKLERLTTTSEKLAFLEQMGVAVTLVEPFTEELAKFSPETFFERYLQEGLRAKIVSVGEDFKFGKDRAGNAELLKVLCEKQGMEFLPFPPVMMEGKRISSSAIREFIRQGEVAQAAKLLGRPYFVVGTVAHGDQRGQKLGFPTANLRASAEKVIPKNGVYVTEVVWQKETYRSVANVGTRPTFETPGHLTVEVHLLDFNAKLYDETLELRFLDRIRDEKKFNSIDELKAQISKDVESARGFAKV